ncbi:MAG: DUF892 family protein [Armatimonas sp.]
MSEVTIETPQQKLMRYIEDAIALENASASTLKDMADSSKVPEESGMYQAYFKICEGQKKRLEERVVALGGTLKRSLLKDMLSSVGAAAANLIHVNKDDEEKGTRNLMQCYTMAALESAVYEALATAAETIGDCDTAQLARDLQKEEQAVMQQAFGRIPMVAASAMAPPEPVPAAAVA